MNDSVVKSDILIIGAGPVGLFAVFQAGLLGLRCHLIDSLPKIGGQCSELYPKKPIYDIPGFPEIIAQDLIDRLMEQCQPFEPRFSLSQKAEQLVRDDEGNFIVVTDKGVEHHAPTIFLAGGLGSFEPRKPQISNIVLFENKGVDYMVSDPEKYRDKNLVIAGGGDSALDWTIHLSRMAKSIILVHRRNEFRGALDSVDKLRDLKDRGVIEVITNAQVISLGGTDKLDSLTIREDSLETVKRVDYFIPLFGLIPKLGPLVSWGIEVHRNAVKVNNAYDYQTNIEGIYAIGDINTYSGKLKLILCGFHEAAVACQSAFKKIYPQKRNALKYTTVTGVRGFDGSVKYTNSTVVKTID